MIKNNLISKVTYKLEGPGIAPDLGSPASPAESLISQFIGVLTIVGAIFFIIQIIFSGYAMMSAQGDQKKLEDARKRLTNGVLGLTIIIVALGAGAFIATLLGIKNPLDLQKLIPKG